MENLTKKYITYKHSYHLVNPSPWPILTSFSALVLTSGAVLYMHSYSNGGLIGVLGFLLVLFSVTCWWRDVIREATYEGHHTKLVQLGLRYGMVLFIVSEILFFVAFLSIFSFKFITYCRDRNSLTAPWNWSLKSMTYSFIKYFNFTFVRM